MPVEPPVQRVDSERIRRCLSQFCESQSEFDRFFSEVFAQLDDLSEQFLHKQKSWSRRREDEELAFSRQAAQLDQQRAAIADEQERLRQSAGHSGEVAAAADDRIRQTLEGIEQEQASFRAAWEQSNTELKQQLVEVRHDRDSLQQERAMLEAELEAVRNRVAEMTEALAEQKREISEERVRWTDEIKRLRRILESLADRPVGHESIAPREAQAAHEPPAASVAACDPDPVLDSVMAQFEMLQRDLARRRKQPAKSG